MSDRPLTLAEIALRGQVRAANRAALMGFLDQAGPLLGLIAFLAVAVAGGAIAWRILS